MPQTQLGITFSHPHIQHLGLSVESALEYALSMGFSHIRIGCYWNSIEKHKDVYDFGELERILDKCEAARQPIIMNLGMKSPRWPEFYIPTYLENAEVGGSEMKERVLLFIEATITKLNKYNCITHWQVENEPFDPSGESNLIIPLSILKEEVGLVRSLDKRHILLSLWGNEMEKRNVTPLLLPLTDSIGLDIYFKQYKGTLFGRSFYTGPQTNDEYFRKFIQNSSKPILITELQGEPWEKNEQGYVSEKQRSISPQLLKKNIERAIRFGSKEILLWGFEYWYFQMKKNNRSYMNILKEFGYHTPSAEAPGAGVDDK